MFLPECVMLVTPLVLEGLDPRSLPSKTILYLLTHILVYCFRCPVLLVTGQQSIFNGTTRNLHQAIVKSCEDKTKVEFIEVVGVANVLEEKVVISYSGLMKRSCEEEDDLFNNLKFIIISLLLSMHS